jgi:hypothetical protein
MESGSYPYLNESCTDIPSFKFLHCLAHGGIKFRFLIIVGILDGRELDVLAIGDLVDKIIYLCSQLLTVWIRDFIEWIHVLDVIDC